jgi:hypothetical protein
MNTADELSSDLPPDAYTNGPMSIEDGSLVAAAGPGGPGVPYPSAGPVPGEPGSPHLAAAAGPGAASTPTGAGTFPFPPEMAMMGPGGIVPPSAGTYQ